MIDQSEIADLMSSFQASADDEAVTRGAWFYAVQIMGHLTTPYATKDAESVASVWRPFLRFFLFKLSPAQRRKLKEVAACLGIGDLSVLFPQQPVTESPLSEHAVEVGPMIDALLRMSRSQTAKFCEELVRIGREQYAKYGRSEQYLQVFAETADNLRKIAARTPPGPTPNASGEYPPPLPPKT